MARLALDQAPIVSLPRRFLCSMPIWGVLAGLLLVIDGDSLLRSRWHPGTLALVHTITLGVLGNAMFGSLLQFLPAAAGVPLRGERLGAWVHVALNAGALSLVCGFYLGSSVLLTLGGLLLPLAFLAMAGIILPAVCRSAGQRLLRMGVGASLVYGLATALVGGALALCGSGRLSLAMPKWVDVHASFGVLGWVVLLLASVGRVVMPMFQGTGVPPVKWHAAWLGSVVVLLPIAAALRLSGMNETGLPATLALFGMSFALTVAWLQMRTTQARRGPLWWSWRGAAFALMASVLALPWQSHAPLLAAALALGVALPLLVTGMALEIVAFLGWIELHRRVGRGVQLPGVQRLMPARERGAVAIALAVAGTMVVLATLYPAAWIARAAGLLQCVAWGGVAAAFLGTRRRVQRFLRDQANPGR
ncbi:hypothetical protein [Dyella amyloliquefaciens]|uniref:hypothetical protein n=1 Tax=Dyella amyloliquefaciens TaxID=1770545 RepID=UPI00102EC1D0|nr:hypothetical protein [Dyella amyloliquefaciens]